MRTFNEDEKESYGFIRKSSLINSFLNGFSNVNKIFPLLKLFLILCLPVLFFFFFLKASARLTIYVFIINYSLICGQLKFNKKAFALLSEIKLNRNENISDLISLDSSR